MNAKCVQFSNIALERGGGGGRGSLLANVLFAHRHTHTRVIYRMVNITAWIRAEESTKVMLRSDRAGLANAPLCEKYWSKLFRFIAFEEWLNTSQTIIIMHDVSVDCYSSIQYVHANRVANERNETNPPLTEREKLFFIVGSFGFSIHWPCNFYNYPATAGELLPFFFFFVRHTFKHIRTIGSHIRRMKKPLWAKIEWFSNFKSPSLWLEILANFLLICRSQKFRAAVVVQDALLAHNEHNVWEQYGE